MHVGTRGETMRRFLLWIASMLVGCFTIMVTTILLAGGGTAIIGSVLLWIVVLLIGIALSAPAFLRPGEFRGGWSIRVPVTLWLILTVVKLISGLGFWILYAVWLLLGRLINRPMSTDSTP